MSVYFAVVGIISLVVFLAAVIAITKISNSISSFSNSLLGTRNIIEGLQNLQETTDNEMQTQPKSVSAMTSIYLPKITKDFPDFNYDEMKSRSQAVLIGYLKALEEKSVENLEDVTPEFKSRLEDQIDMAKGTKYALHYWNPKIHRTEISNYSTQKGKCCITFQSSIQYNYYKTKDGTVIEGGQDVLTQSRYDVTCIYIQDRDKVETIGDAALGINCPNCGAPIRGLGQKSCSYCGSAIVEFNLKAWAFSDVARNSST